MEAKEGLRSTACDAQLFKAIARRWATGVAVVTTCDVKGDPHGITMSAVTSLSLNPMYFLICVNSQSATLRHMLSHGAFAINVLDEAQTAEARQFSSATPDRFCGVRYGRGSHGLPILPGALAYAACRVVSSFPGGDHTIVVGELVEGSVSEEPNALLHLNGQFGRVERLITT